MLNRALTVTAALLVGAVGTAQAAGTWTNPVAACGGGNFVTCASVNVSWAGNVLTLTATNTGTVGEIWKSIGFVNLGTISAYTVGGQVGYSAPPPNNLSNFPNNQAYATTNNQASMIANSGTGTWTFTFSGLSAAELDAAMVGAWVAVHAISGSQGCSTKFAIDADGGTHATETPTTACLPDDDPLAVVPEPATMVLLATGLIGLAGAQMRRRKNTKV